MSDPCAYKAKDTQHAYTYFVWVRKVEASLYPALSHGIPLLKEVVFPTPFTGDRQEKRPKVLEKNWGSRGGSFRNAELMPPFIIKIRYSVSKLWIAMPWSATVNSQGTMR